MGQRLCVNIIKDDQTLMNVYMHWSAYTIEASNVIDAFINLWNNKIETGDMPEGVDLNDPAQLKDQICLTMMEAWPGAKPVAHEDGAEEVTSTRLLLFGEGMNESASVAFATEEDWVKIDRNAGLIGFTEASINGNNEAAEGSADLYLELSNNMVYEINFGVCWIQEESAYKEEAGEDEAELEKQIYRQNEIDPYDVWDHPIDIDEWSTFYRVLHEAAEKGYYVIGTKKVGDDGDKWVLQMVA